MVSGLSSGLRHVRFRRPIPHESGRGPKGKIMRKRTILTILAALAFAAGGARAEGLGRACAANAGSDYLTVEGLLASMIQHGYRIRGLDIKDGCGKFRALDRNGAEAALFVDMSSAAKAGGAGRRND
jgi:hypothetical protein